MLSVFDAVSIRVKAPEGDMIVIFSEDDNKPVRVEIFIGKAGNTLRAWATSFAEIISLALQNGADLDELCNVLYGQVSDKNVMDTSGLVVSSGPEAFALAILKYKAYKLKNPNESTQRHIGYFTNPKRKDLGR